MEDLQKEAEQLRSQYEELKSQGLALNIARGKPSERQLDLTNALDGVLDGDYTSRDGIDCRNYGDLTGLPEMKELFADILGVPAANVMVGGNSSLNLMADALDRAMLHGVLGGTPWCKLDKVRFICPVPGYDRHFSLCENLGIEMINVPNMNDGPFMDMVEKLVQDESVKGIWCVPCYSNPEGLVYGNDVVRRLAALKPAAKDFRIFWDNAYCLHQLYPNQPPQLLNIFAEAQKQGNEDLLYIFASTSKVSFAGAGVAAFAASDANLAEAVKQTGLRIIGYDKVNQLRHARFFKDKAGVMRHMQKQADIIRPKFELAVSIMDHDLKEGFHGRWSRPQGGYFISVFLREGCASCTWQLCKDAGLTLTKAGATYPYGKDPFDSNIRIAPTMPPLDELEDAMHLFCLCVKLATVERQLAKQQQEQ